MAGSKISATFYWYKMNLILIRHGESQQNALLTSQLDSELTPTGILQAHRTGRFLKDKFKDISEYTAITSPYLRCLQTASIIKEETGLNFIVDESPREVMVNYEICEVLNHSDKFPDFLWSHTGDLTFKKEAPDEFIARMENFYNKIKQYDKLLVVSHGTPVTTLYHLSIGFPGKIYFGYVRNCSISYSWEGEGVYFDEIC